MHDAAYVHRPVRQDYETIAARLRRILRLHQPAVRRTLNTRQSLQSIPVTSFAENCLDVSTGSNLNGQPYIGQNY